MEMIDEGNYHMKLELYSINSLEKKPVELQKCIVSSSFD